MCDDVSKQRSIQTRGDYSEKEFFQGHGYVCSELIPPMFDRLIHQPTA